MKYLGLTGGIASGKSLVADFFNEFGCYTLDADSISKIVMSKSGSAYSEVVKQFGEQILNIDGEIDRKLLREIIFNDNEKKTLLEKIVHPHIFQYEKNVISGIKGKDDKAIVITHAALMIEKNSFTRFEGVILIFSTIEQQLDRLTLRDNISKDNALKIINSQMPFEEKLKYADFVIDNSRNIEFTRNEVKRVFEHIKLVNYCEKQLSKHKIIN